jgi:hypothetical protein
MTRFTLRLSIYLLVAFTLIAMAPRGLSRAPAPNQVLRGFTAGCLGKPQSCWYGIVPSRTTREEAQDILSGLGYKLAVDHNAVGPQVIETVASPEGFGCAVSVKTRPRPQIGSSQPLHIVEEFTLHDCHDLHLGDVLFMGEEPALAYSCAEGARVTLVGGIWLNVTGDSPRVYVESDPIYNMTFGFNSPYLTGWRFESLRYGLMSEAALKTVIWGKHCFNY